jgi:hypothetical protein
MKNFRFIFTIACLALVFIATSGFKACEQKDPGTFRGKLYQDKQTHSPKGIRIYSRTSINPELPALYDQGLDKLFRIASAPPNNYTGFNTHAAYTIWLFPRSDKCIAAGFLVDASGSPYDGTEYDKDPRPGAVTLCAAGAMIRPGASASGYGSPGMLIVDDKATAVDISRFEGEHNVLLEVDIERFSATQFHVGSAGGHPILPDTDGSFAAEASYQAIGFALPVDITDGDGNIIAKKGALACALVTK